MTEQKTIDELKSEFVQAAANLAAANKAANKERNARKRAAKALDRWHDKYGDTLTLEEDKAATGLVDSLDPTPPAEAGEGA